MKQRIPSTAPPRREAGWAIKTGCRAALCRRTALFAMILVIACSTPTLGQIANRMGLFDAPNYRLEILAKIEPENHPGFGSWSASLGDINGDGFDDIAISTLADTTFIFLGGNPFDLEPDYFVLGGRMGLAAGDFNGDGRMDIATSMGNMRVPDPEGRGTVRIYLNTGSLPPFAETPDRVIIGEWQNQTGKSQSFLHQGVITADLNGDGVSDLLYTSRIRQDPVADGRLNLILGGEDFLTRIPYQFLARPRAERGYFAEEYLIGNFNGDGCDDLVIFGSYVPAGTSTRRYEMGIYLGKLSGEFGDPEILNSSDSAWVAARSWANASDVNGDGYDDLIDGTSLLFGATHLFLGSTLVDQVRRIWDNDSIPNQDKNVFVGAKFVCPVGDMTGDGIDDCIIGWGTIIFQTGTVYLVYPAGPNNDWKTATGSVGIIPEEDELTEGAYDAGDLNGDGFDDMVVLGKPGIFDKYNSNYRAWIYSGSRRLRTGLGDLPIPETGDIQLFPQPLHAGQNLHVRLESEQRSNGSLVLSDLLGRMLYEQNIEVPEEGTVMQIPTQRLVSGTYLVRYQPTNGSPRSTILTVF
jgi:hypothetical protein